MKIIKVMALICLLTVGSQINSMERNQFSEEEESPYVKAPFTNFVINMEQSPIFTEKELLNDRAGGRKVMQIVIDHNPVVREDEENPYVKAPFTNFVINNEVCTVSLANLTMWEWEKEDIGINSKKKNIEKDTHSMVIFEGRGDPSWMIREITCKQMQNLQYKKGYSEQECREELKKIYSDNPQFQLNEGTWMLGIHLRFKDKDRDPGLFGSVDGLVQFLPTDEIKKRTLNPYYKMGGKYGKYELVKGWNVHFYDSIRSVMEAYLGQSLITYSRIYGMTGNSTKGVFNCSAFASALLRCAGISSKDLTEEVERTLDGGKNSDVFLSTDLESERPLYESLGEKELTDGLSVMTPYRLRNSVTTYYHYQPLNKENWEEIAIKLREEQRFIDPNVTGLGVRPQTKKEGSKESTKRGVEATKETTRESTCTLI